MRYNGGKGVCFPLLINLMPQHTRYIETHLGGGAVNRNKRPAQQQIGIDIDPAVAELWNRQWPGLCDVINSDAVDYLERNALDGDTLIYADPPYLPETRRRSRVYRHDYSANDHERLLECLTAVPCRVMISGYPSALYERYLGGWSLIGSEHEPTWKPRKNGSGSTTPSPRFFTTIVILVQTPGNARSFVAAKTGLGIASTGYRSQRRSPFIAG